MLWHGGESTFLKWGREEPSDKMMEAFFCATPKSEPSFDLTGQDFSEVVRAQKLLKIGIQITEAHHAQGAPPTVFSTAIK